MPDTSQEYLYPLLHEVALMLPRGSEPGTRSTPGQNKVIKVLAKSGPMLTQELRARLGVSSSTLSETLGKLEAEGLIERARSHRGGNELVVSLTDKGVASNAERCLARDDREERYFDVLDPDERAQLGSLLGKLLESWRSDDPQTKGSRRQKRWEENARRQCEEQEIDDMLEAVAHAR